MKRKNVRYEARYKYKLNMLETGLVMVKIIGALLAVGVPFWAAELRGISVIVWILAGAILAVLMILAGVELRQDKVLNDIAMRENGEGDKR